MKKKEQKANGKLKEKLKKSKSTISNKKRKVKIIIH